MNVSLRNEGEAPGKLIRALVLIGYSVFGLLGIFFILAVVMGVVGLLPTLDVDAHERAAAFALIVLGVPGASYSIWRLREHVRRHGTR